MSSGLRAPCISCLFAKTNKEAPANLCQNHNHLVVIHKTIKEPNVHFKKKKNETYAQTYKKMEKLLVTNKILTYTEALETKLRIKNLYLCYKTY